MIVVEDNISQSVLSIGACGCILLGFTIVLDDMLGCRVFFDVVHPFLHVNMPR